MDYGIALKKIRCLTNTSLDSLSENTGINSRKIQNIEEGITNLKAEDFNKITKYFNVSGEIFTFYSIEEKDVPEDRKTLYKTLRPPLAEIVKDIVQKNYKNSIL